MAEKTSTATAKEQAEKIERDEVEQKLKEKLQADYTAKMKFYDDAKERVNNESTDEKVNSNGKLTPQWGKDVAHAASAVAQSLIKTTYVVDVVAEACVNVSIKLAVATCNTEEDLAEYLACRQANKVIFNS